MDATTPNLDGHPDIFANTSNFVDYVEELDNDTSGGLTDEEYKEYLHYMSIARDIWIYAPGFLICIGIIGNILSALVMTRPALKKTVSSLFFTVLAFVDTFCLLTGLLRYWILGLTDHDVRTNSDASCKIHTFFVYWSVDFSGWILVLVAAERCLAANLPHVYKQSCTRAKAAVSLIISAVFLALINCHFLFGFYLRTKVSNSTGKITKYCDTKPQFDHYQSVIFPWIDLIFFSLGPFFCILLCNISIVVRVLRSRAATAQDQKANHRLSSMTAILICVSIFYILCTAPVAAYLIAQNFWLNNSGWVFYSKMQIYFAFAAILSYFNNSMNFFLYCISGPRFRKELLKMFRCAKVPASQESSVSGL